LLRKKKYGGDNMLKIIGSIIIFISCSLVGFIYGEGLKKRVIELRLLEDSMQQLQNHIVYSHTPLPLAFESIGNKTKEPIKKLYSDMARILNSNKVESVYEAFKLAIEINKNNFNLKNQDINILLDFTKTLGEFDIEGQNNMFNLVFKNINKELSLAEEKMHKNLKMYRGLGVSAGATIVILLL
jgi:stage III sporulation protein AB